MLWSERGHLILGLGTVGARGFPAPARPQLFLCGVLLDPGGFPSLFTLSVELKMQMSVVPQ